MKTRIHVNQHHVRHNKKFPDDKQLPPLTVKDYKQNRKCHAASIQTAEGVEVARLVSNPDKPLPCGATVWLETQLEVTIKC